MYTFYDKLIGVIGDLEKFPDDTKKEAEQKHYRDLCKGAGRLLSSLRNKIPDEEFVENGQELRTFITDLETLVDEGSQEVIDDAVVRCLYNRTLKYSSKLLGKFIHDYMLDDGPFMMKDDDD